MVLVEGSEVRVKTVESPIEFGQEVVAQFEALDRDLGLESQFTDLIAREAWICIDNEWIVHGTEPAPELALALFDETGNVIRKLGSHGDEWGKRSSAAVHGGKNRAEMGPLSSFVRVAGRGFAGQQVVGGQGMISIVMGH